jgi:acyl dehydratase
VKYARVYFEDVKVGDELPALVKGPIQQIQLTRYAGASGDFNPIHQDEEFARAAGMGGIFAHGMLSMGFVAQVVTDWAGPGTVRRIAVRFAALVRLKDTVTCRGRVTAKASPVERATGDGTPTVELDIWAENQRGERVVTGTATVLLPARGPSPLS